MDLNDQLIVGIRDDTEEYNANRGDDEPHLDHHLCLEINNWDIWTEELTDSEREVILVNVMKNWLQRGLVSSPST